MGLDQVHGATIQPPVRPRTPPGRKQDRLGDNAERPDGVPKVKGTFAFSSDLWADNMLWGRTLRSPHPAARILSIDADAARRLPGVHAVLTHEDVPGKPTYGLAVADQSVFAADTVRYQGEPIAAVAAVHPEVAARALEAIRVEYEPLDPLTDPEQALDGPPIHPDGNVYRHIKIRRGDPDTVGDVVVEGAYRLGMQDQAFMGPEAGLAIPDDAGGVDLYIATQDLHADRDQVAACLGLAPDRVRLTLSGVGGAFGAREDLSLHVHACLLALRTGRPVKMVYSRQESFFAHVHRHPARLWYRHHATRDGTLVKVEARVLLDGGAYASTSAFVIGNATCFAAGPYRVPNAVVDGWVVRTNNPPCGAMRGFGTVQACFGHESQMDRLARELDMDPVDLRLRNAVRTGDALITGQVIKGVAPLEECLRAAAAFPLPPSLDEHASPLELPGGAGNTARPSDIRRGVGYAVSVKNFMFPEGFDDYSTAAVRLERSPDGQPVAVVHCAAAEVGQGFVTLAQQIVRTELQVDHVILRAADTRIGSAGSSSASRQASMSGGAIQLACVAVRAALFRRAARELGIRQDEAPTRLALEDGEVHDETTGTATLITDLLDDDPIEVVREFHHAPTQPLNEQGQGDAHVSFAFAAHRAVVDVDQELGLTRVQQITTGQDVGKALNPLQVIGQIEGGIAQGLGLAVMEEVVVQGGRVLNASFTDYLIPTTLDAPGVEASLIEEAEPGLPFGAKGVGEPPTISSTPAIVNAMRAATGLPLERVPVRPEDLSPAQSSPDATPAGS